MPISEQSAANEAQKFRPNVAICITNAKNEVLLIKHSEHIKRYWQFLQGGINAGESITEAVRRELHEELGISKFDILLVKKNIYKYKWPAKLIKRGTDPDKQGYIGQVQSLAVVRVPETRPRLNPDAREAAATGWFPASRMLTRLNPVRRTLGRKVVVELRKLKITE